MYNNISHQNYIYSSGKPEMSLGDSSLDSESFNEIEEEKKKENDIIITDNFYEIPKEKEIPSINIPFNEPEIFPQNKTCLCFCSVTKDTERGGIKRNSNMKEDNFSIKKKINLNKENNRYSDINIIYQNNCRFFNSLQDENENENDNDNENEEEDIVNNEISVNFIEDINDDDKSKKEKQIEVLLDENLTKLDSNNEISNNNIIFNKITNDKIDEMKNDNIIKKKEINENIQKIIQNINKNKCEWNKKNEEIKNNEIKILNKDNNEDSKDSKYFIENKENLNSNGKDDIETNINVDQLKINNNNQEKSSINKSKNQNNQVDINKNLNNIFFDLQNKNKLNVIYLSKSKNSNNNVYKRKKFISTINQTKKYKIFHNFLSVSIDTTVLNSLEDDINTLLLNPKITYNYPYNNLEKELE